MTESWTLDALPTDEHVRIVALCDDFEAAWLNGQPTSMTDALRPFQGPVRSVVLRELLHIEGHYRSRNQPRLAAREQLLAENAAIADELAAVLNEQDFQTDDTRPTESTQSQTARLRHVEPLFETFPVEFGRYRVLEQLGEGGMGGVFLARDSQLERLVALKLPRTEWSEDSQFAVRFDREAKAAATINHPNLCSVYDVGQIDGRHYLAMEYIEGDSLAALLKSGRKFTDREAVELIQKVAAALQEAHDRGIVHRDLKPANIMINHRGEPVVTDFGLAQRQEDDRTQITQVGQILGTPAYMSPEQVDGDLARIGPATDVYSLGVVLYELLTGQRPFQGSTAAVFGKILCADPIPFSQWRADIDSALQTMCLQMMARDPADRFASMAEVVTSADHWLQLTAIDSSSGNASAGTSAGTTTEAGGATRLSADQESHAATNGDVWRSAVRTWVWLTGLVVALGSIPVVIHFANSDTQLPDPADSGTRDTTGRTENQLPNMNSGTDGSSATAEGSTPANDAGTSHSPPVIDPAFERHFAEWAIQHGAKVDLLKEQGGLATGVAQTNDLPTDEFYVVTIANLTVGKDDVQEFQRISQLRGLAILKFAANGAPSGALDSVRFGRNLREMSIRNTQLRVSELEGCSGLERLTKLVVSAGQLDDDWKTLKRLARLQILEIDTPTREVLEQLSRSASFPTSSVRKLQLGYSSEALSQAVQHLQAANPQVAVLQYGTPTRRLGLPVEEQALEHLLQLGFAIEVSTTDKRGATTTLDKTHRLGKRTLANVVRVTFPAGFEITPESIRSLDQLCPVFHIIADSTRNSHLLVDYVATRPMMSIELRNSDMSTAQLAKLMSHMEQGSIDLAGVSLSKPMIRTLKEDYPLITLKADVGYFGVTTRRKTER